MMEPSSDRWESSLQAEPVWLTPRPARSDAIDWLRGLVMVLMALDHTRDFFSDYRGDPLDLSQTSVALFLTRWVTHFCAPVFVFLAGTGAFLAGARGKSTPALAWFLLTRGLWLVVLEFSLVHLGWFFNVHYDLLIGQVIWAIGGSMMILAALAALPAWVIGFVGVALISGLGALDGVRPDSFGPAAPLWQTFVSGGFVPLWPGTNLIIGYPILPWLGVMLAGYGFGQICAMNRGRRRRITFFIGLGVTLLFVAVRWVNRYGDPQPWELQDSESFTVLSFLNCNKYPPSLLYVAMTLGPALILLALQDCERGPLARFLVTFGRVPLFYYLLHVPLIHMVAIGLAVAKYEDIGFMFQHIMIARPGTVPEDYGYDLPVVYALTAGIVAALYPLCWWFAQVKARSRAWWLGYL